jgi:DNA-binding MarR family transcriptional regulator
VTQSLARLTSVTSDGSPRFPELAAEIRPALMRLNRRIRMENRDGRHTLTQLSALSTVEQHGPLSAGDLAGFERVQPPSMTKVIAVLEDAGLVRRDAHPTDKRQAIIAITPAGAALLDTSRRVSDAWLGVQLAKLSADERKQLAELAPILAKLIED